MLIFSSLNLYIDFSPRETDFVHGAWYVLTFVRGNCCMQICLRKFMTVDFSLRENYTLGFPSWNWFFHGTCHMLVFHSWKLLRPRFWSWNLLHVDFSLRETILIFNDYDHKTHSVLIFSVRGTYCLLIFVSETRCMFIFLFVKLVLLTFLLVLIFLCVKIFACWFFFLLESCALIFIPVKSILLLELVSYWFLSMEIVSCWFLFVELVIVHWFFSR